MTAEPEEQGVDPVWTLHVGPSESEAEEMRQSLYAALDIVEVLRTRAREVEDLTE